MTLEEPLSYQTSVEETGDGRFEVTGLRLTGYDVHVEDAQGRRRARALAVALDTPGQTRSLDLTFTALGTVSGRVVNPDATSAAGLGVTLRSNHPWLGGYAGAVTNAAGFYEILSVPAGAFTVGTGDPSRSLIGEAAGTIEDDGSVVTADILLVANAIVTPVVRHDASNFRFDIQGDGRVASSLLDDGRLDVIVNGQPAAFEPQAIATFENAGREIAVRGANLAGLNVTRKVFVPLDGYFARRLEILSNPTPAPMTVDVRATAVLPPEGSGAPGIVRTSSGDGALAVGASASADRWVAFDDSAELDPFLSANQAPIGFAFDGEGGAERADLATVVTAANTTLRYGWNSVSIAPGETIALMHFVTRQVARTGATSAAERLVQLPPEALAGLSVEELSWIRNFAIPAGGLSALAPLPLATGTVSGRALAGDGVTPVPSARVAFTSGLPYFGRTWTVTTSASGQFSVTGALADGNTVAVPAGAFALRALHPLTAGVSPITLGTFAQGELSAQADVVFSTTGVVRGLVRRFGGATVTSGTIELTRAAPAFSIADVVNADGSFVFTGVPEGTFTLRASVPHPQGTSLSGTQLVTVTQGTAAAQDVRLQETGALTGLVSTQGGTAAVNVLITLTQGATSYATRTDGAGRYAFADVPTGRFGVRASLSSGLVIRAEVVITAAGIVQDLMFLLDSDNDGLPDQVETQLGLNPFSADSNGNGVSDANEDADGDGLSNLRELQEGTNPGIADTDADGLSDSEELFAGADGYVTDPRRPDTDGDGMPDGFESFYRLNPTDSSDAALDAGQDFGVAHRNSSRAVITRMISLVPSRIW